MIYLTCTTITSVDLAHYGVSRAKDWVSVDCGTKVPLVSRNSLQPWQGSVLSVDLSHKGVSYREVTRKKDIPVLSWYVFEIS